MNTETGTETETETMTARNIARIAGLKSLRYGVELEIVGLTDIKAATIIQGIVGGEAPVYTTSGPQGYETRMADGRKWKAVYDGSVRGNGGGACEVVSPILTWADMDQLQAIVRALRAAGGRVNESCGMHVHVDGAGFKSAPAKVRNLMALAYRWENVAVNVARVLQHRTTWCRTFEANVVDRFRARAPRNMDQLALAWYGNGNAQTRRAHYDQTRYHWINVHALFDKGTIEFRLFNGTLHAGHVKANVLFALGMASCALSMRSISFRGQTTDSRTLADGRRAVSKHDRRMFIVHVLCLVGDEFKTYRKHLANFIGGEEEVA